LCSSVWERRTRMHRQLRETDRSMTPRMSSCCQVNTRTVASHVAVVHAQRNAHHCQSEQRRSSRLLVTMAFGSRRRTRQTSARFPVLGVRELAQATVAAQIGAGLLFISTSSTNHSAGSLLRDRMLQEQTSGPFEFWQQSEREARPRRVEH
jgi:hypothetical protein